jgi:energy-coupling factor transport system ATP-binding protein
MKLGLESVRFARGSWSLFSGGTFPEGIHLVTGAVGSGKSTLALLIAGLLQPASGLIVRKDISKSMISFQFPEYHVTGSSVSEECRSWGLDPGIIGAQARLVKRMDTPPLRLSRGELKRLHLACVLSEAYDLLVLDEPFSSLDCTEKERVCEEITRRSGGITIIFTHEQAIFPRVDCLWEIESGDLICLGRVPDALRQWDHAPPVIKNLVAAGKIPENIAPQDLMEAACRT